VLAFVCTVLLLIADRILVRGDSSVLHTLGVLALLVGPVFFVPPFFLLQKHGDTRKPGPYYATTKVVDRGLYAIVRHPQYLGYALIAAGFALLSQRATTVALGGGAVVFFYLHTLREEAHCVKHLGERYRTYMQQVPRFNALRGTYRYLRARPGRPRS
jgi:protein-S-isoprenylcysteine O-methyltransferase Ste14